MRREEKYRQLVGRRTSLSYAEGVNVTAAAQSYSTAIAQRYQTENFYVHPSDRLPFPLQFRNHDAVLENHSGKTTRPRKTFDDIFSRLDTIPVCDGHPAIFRQQVRAMHICVAHKNDDRCLLYRISVEPKSSLSRSCNHRLLKILPTKFTRILLCTLQSTAIAICIVCFYRAMFCRNAVAVGRG